MFRKENIKQNTPAWLEWRKGKIMASDAPILVHGCHFHRTPYQLWEEKLGLRDGSQQTDAMSYGKRMEPVARAAYEQMTGAMVTPVVISHGEKDYLGASLDGLSLENDRAVEIKCAGESDHQCAQQGKVPDKYYPQVQHQLACLGHEKMHYFSYHGSEGVIVEVCRDDAYIQRMYCIEEEFWEQVMEMRAPQLTDADYREMVDPLWGDLGLQLRDVSKEIKRLQEMEDSLRERLISMAGENNCQGLGVKMTKSIRKGSVDYSRIPELQKLDLETYRKAPTHSFRFSFTK